ncbi:MAG: class I SAM-dependent methyltransferase, partial [Propionibacteriales bacterium]|nr:class I SAM-dependent methyltransferase [Propionibacteriales bacterium]
NFSDYAYYSSYSDSWVAHAATFVDTAITALDLGPDSFVVEVASNDGYLLQHAVARGLRCLGIEPSVNCGQAARDRGVPTHTAFLSQAEAHRLVAEHGQADLVVANNVWAHIPDIIDFTRGLRELTTEAGRISIEVHHALHLVADAQFDTIYHEHFQYWTVLAAQRGLAAAGLTLIDVEELPTHGGSIRLWAMRDEHAVRPTPAVARVQQAERAAGLDTIDGYTGLAVEVHRIRRDLVRFLVEAADQGHRVVGYGAPGKGQTLLNFCGIRSDLLGWLADRNTYKHGRFSPGMRIEVVDPERIDIERPDFVLVLPWNLRTELTAQLSHIAEWGGRLVFAQPRLEVVDPTPHAHTGGADGPRIGPTHETKVVRS